LARGVSRWPFSHMHTHTHTHVYTHKPRLPCWIKQLHSWIHTVSWNWSSVWNRFMSFFLNSIPFLKLFNVLCWFFESEINFAMFFQTFTSFCSKNDCNYLARKQIFIGIMIVFFKHLY
jgi:hypothetical protein